MTAPARPTTRNALVIATGSYRDPGLPSLRAPLQDGLELAAVLAEPQVGGFAARTLLDPTERDVRRAVADLLDRRGPDELVLLYLSCHGWLDPRRQLYLAATDTEAARFAATGLDASWLSGRLDECRAQQVVILDCCYSGAFPRGTKGRGPDLPSLVTERGRGRIVLTASRPTESAFEGDPRHAGQPVGSVFTAMLVEGIRSGRADADGDGVITVDEAYDYAAGRVRELGSPQTPQRSLLEGEGRIMLARRPGPLPVARAGAVPPSASTVGAAAVAGPPAASTAPAVDGPGGARIRPGRAWVVLAVLTALVVLAVVADAVVALARMS